MKANKKRSSKKSKSKPKMEPNAKAFRLWFEQNFFTLKELLEDCETEKERDAASQYYLATLGVARLAWDAGREVEGIELGRLSGKVVAGFIALLRLHLPAETIKKIEPDFRALLEQLAREEGKRDA